MEHDQNPHTSAILSAQNEFQSLLVQKFALDNQAEDIRQKRSIVGKRLRTLGAYLDGAQAGIGHATPEPKKKRGKVAG